MAAVLFCSFLRSFRATRVGFLERDSGKDRDLLGAGGDSTGEAEEGNEAGDEYSTKEAGERTGERLYSGMEGEGVE